MVWGCGVFSVLPRCLAQALVVSCSSVSLCSLRPDDVTSFCLRCHRFLEPRFVHLIWLLSTKESERSRQSERRGWRETQRDFMLKMWIRERGMIGGGWEGNCCCRKIWREKERTAWHPINTGRPPLEKLSRLRSDWNWIQLDIYKAEQWNGGYGWIQHRLPQRRSRFPVFFSWCDCEPFICANYSKQLLFFTSIWCWMLTFHDLIWKFWIKLSTFFKNIFVVFVQHSACWRID